MTRLLDKDKQPTYESFCEHIGLCQEMFKELDSYVKQYQIERVLDFPYGNNYGWGYKYYQKKKLLFIVFAEKDAFTVMIRLSGKDIDKLVDISDYTKELIANKYPCGTGGWINYQVNNVNRMKDLLLIIGNKKFNK